MITDLNFICIYIMINNFTGQMYVGKTINFFRRVNEHFRGIGAENQRIDRAILKYGREAFTFKPLEIFEENDEDLIYEREKYWISKYNVFLNDFHYNLTEGGDGFGAGENHPNYRYDIDTNVLVEEYFDNGLNKYEIADKYNISPSTVYDRIISTGRKLRGISEAKKKKYARIVKLGFNRGKQNYVLMFNGERLKKSIYPDKLSNWFLENYPLEIIKIPKEEI